MASSTLQMGMGGTPDGGTGVPFCSSLGKSPDLPGIRTLMFILLSNPPSASGESLVSPLDDPLQEKVTPSSADHG